MKIEVGPNQLIWFAIGGILAGLAWVPFGIAWQLAVLWFLVMAWLVAPSHKASFALIFVYYLVTSREVGQMIHRFTGMNELAAWCIVGAYAGSIALLWSIAWQRKPIWRFTGLCGLLVIASVPPLGGFIYGSPLLAAGWLFPSMGFMGIALLVTSWGSVFAFTVLPKSTTKTIAIAAVGSLAVVSAIANAQYKAPESDLVYALNTNFPLFPVKLEDQYERHLELTRAAMAALEQPYPTVVMPEEIGGFWQPRYAWLWADVSKAYQAANKTLIVGFDTKPDQYANTAKMFGMNSAKYNDVLAKVPAPIGGWKPWANVHAPTRWTSPATVAINGSVLTFIFCWEELVPWPWLATASFSGQDDQKSRSVVVMVNHWFAKDLDIGDSQARSTQAWARLFGWSYQRVVNEP